MARPYAISDTIIQNMVDEFKKNLESTKVTGKKFTYTHSFAGNNEKASIFFTPSAYCKMLCLVDEFDSEVAWHGVANRVGDGEFLISDILVYPQEVSGATVTVDDEKYVNWVNHIDDETYPMLRMQGHSHVNMGTSPSGTDITHQETVLSNVKDGFYIFLIWNKKGERYGVIYDIDNNLVYDKEDISYGFLDGDDDFSAFLSDVKNQVKKKTWTTSITYTGKNSGSWKKYNGIYASTNKKDNNVSNDDDWDDDWYDEWSGFGGYTTQYNKKF